MILYNKPNLFWIQFYISILTILENCDYSMISIDVIGIKYNN